MTENGGIERPKAKPKLALELNEKTKKVLIILLAFLIFAFLLFNFRHLFIAAVVNNKPITRFALDRELEKQGGQQVLESLITKSLILQEAKKQGVKINDEEINEKIGEIETQLESQGTDLDTLLQTQGQTRQSLEEQIKIELIIGEILNEKVSVTDEEIKDYFEENKESFEEGVTLEEVKEQIRENLRQTKLSEKFQSWLEELKQKARIYYFLKF
ncbi:SurA N-terminal domain-containing protein [Patescibacteria group bacterium]|nr:SurA N-terminal domain-containing protein [Patescibacteria group bacterium]